MAQKLATRKRLDMSIAYQHTLMDTLNQRVSTRQQAIALNVGTKINLYDAKEELEKSQATLASDEGQLIETDAALKELQSEKAKTVSQFIADNENKLAEASRKVLIRAPKKEIPRRSSPRSEPPARLCPGHRRRSRSCGRGRPARCRRRENPSAGLWRGPAFQANASKAASAFDA